MAIQIQRRKGTTFQHKLFVGAPREYTIDIDKPTIVIHDGGTLGGYPLALEDHFHAPQGTVIGSIFPLSDTFFVPCDGRVISYEDDPNLGFMFKEYYRNIIKNWDSKSLIIGGFTLHDIGYSEYLKQWVACASDGNVYTSLDFILWSQEFSSFSSSAVRRTKYHEGYNLWVIVGDDGNISTSVNGLDWNKKLGSQFGSVDIRCLEYDYEKVVIGGAYGVMSFSTDSRLNQWTTISSNISNNTINDIYRDDDHGWVLVGTSGRVATSPDGITWTNRPTDLIVELLTCCYHNDRLYVGGKNGLLAYTDNFSDWYTIDILNGTYSINRLLNQNGSVLAVCSKGTILSLVDDWEALHLSDVYASRDFMGVCANSLSEVAICGTGGIIAKSVIPFDCDVSKEFRIPDLMNGDVRYYIKI